jgi:hypothetical protein
MTHASRLPAALLADCSRCAGLCCVVPAFYAAQGFGFDKPAHAPCDHLTADNRCAIHAQRAAHGFTACAGFDCYGAGQRVTGQLGGDAAWRDSPEAAARAFAAYSSLLVLHRLMAALTLAEPAAAPSSRARLRLCRMALNRLCRTDEAKRGRVDVARIQRETFALIRDACPGAG